MKVLQSALEDLARGDTSTLDAFFHVVQTNVLVADTSATCHFHCITLDGNGRPRVDALIKHLLQHLADYAIPRKRLQEAFEFQKATGSSTKHMALLLEAMGLFTKLSKSGEGGELILFLMAERFLKLPQLMCKMSLKTSSQMHYHGADGLHVGVDSDKNKLCLYWGESKLHADVTGGINACMKSLAPLLLGTGGLGAAEERDLQLLGAYMDLNNVALESALKKFLDPDSPDFNSVEFRGLCLVGFDSEDYPSDVNSATLTQVKTALEARVKELQSFVGKRLVAEKINSFSIHVFLLPFPSVDGFRKSFQAALDPNGNA